MDFKVVGGNIQNLAPGKSNNTEIEVDQNNYKTIVVKGKVINDKVGENEKKITYSVEILDRDNTLELEKEKKLNAIIKTEPAGYEYLFINEPMKWSTDKEEITTVKDDGTVCAKCKGCTIVTASMLDEKDSVVVTVGHSRDALIRTLEIITMISLILAILSIATLLIISMKH